MILQYSVSVIGAFNSSRMAKRTPAVDIRIQSEKLGKILE